MIDAMIGRRGLLGGALALGGMAMASSAGATTLLSAAMSDGAGGVERRLAFRNVHTNERIDARYFTAKGYDAQGIAEINHGLRDWRSGQIAPIDRELLDLLVDLREKLDVSARRPFDLISGYRSPASNAALRERGGEHTGVATKSQHMLAKATDIALPGIALDRIRDAARSMQRGGVGYYPVDGFVHVDTGRVRTW